jgi:hypothetical protein
VYDPGFASGWAVGGGRREIRNEQQQNIKWEEREKRGDEPDEGQEKGQELGEMGRVGQIPSSVTGHSWPTPCDIFLGWTLVMESSTFSI